ncbi:hypothetical protein [Cohnella luojiensis]|uniref:hypothetical protein n=1 Tax=Cohnella luojiensis TaxID=652876 RepID=UPI001F113F95|nr:hypothetical protein [Cohnella luojiensis]
MGKWLIYICLLFVLVGCSKNNDLAGEQPPKAMIQIGNQLYETKLGTYCWTTKCVDTVGPVELLKDKKPIIVNPSDEITLVMDYESKPNKFHVVQINEEWR